LGDHCAAGWWRGSTQTFPVARAPRAEHRQRGLCFRAQSFPDNTFLSGTTFKLRARPCSCPTKQTDPSSDLEPSSQNVFCFCSCPHFCPCPLQIPRRSRLCLRSCHLLLFPRRCRGHCLYPDKVHPTTTHGTATLIPKPAGMVALEIGAGMAEQVLIRLAHVSGPQAVMVGQILLHGSPRRKLRHSNAQREALLVKSFAQSAQDLTPSGGELLEAISLQHDAERCSASHAELSTSDILKC
jgi:hypothetical protein